jgi:Flp pilus assembly protein TadD
VTLQPPPARTTALLAIGIVVPTILVYAQTLRFAFVTLDDPLYVTANPHIRNGITGEGIRWVFTHEHGGSWHPVTGLSHMLDCELYGLRAGGHHFTNVAIHVANSVLLFALLLRMTRAAWPSTAVALLFAVHPLHVESVAWVSGRKDVLSAFFGFLAIGAYVAYTRRGGAGRYLLVLALFALALMAKPMLVSLPVLLLCLDYWPLGRVAPADRERAAGGRGKERALPGPSATGELPAGVGNALADTAVDGQGSFGALVVEKLPMALTAAIAGAGTYLGHRGAGTLAAGETIPLGLRFANAAVSYARYAAKTLWPFDLGVHYQHPNLPGGTPWAWWQVAGAAGLLAAVSVWVVRQRRDRPYALAGWLWYLAALVPVLGLVQVGRHAMADRYTYIPLVGLFVIGAWRLAEVQATRSGAGLLRPAAAAGAAAVLVACGVCSYSQARHWRSSRALYEHTLAVAPGSALMHNNLAIELAREGETAAAIDHYRRALVLEPDFPNAHNNLANALQRAGRLDEAVTHYRRALEIEPAYASAHANLGMALRAQGKLAAALAHLARAVEIDPRSADAHNNLGLALLASGRIAEAISHFRAALELAPDDPLPRENLAYALRLPAATGSATQDSGPVPGAND